MDTLTTGDARDMCAGPCGQKLDVTRPTYAGPGGLGLMCRPCKEFAEACEKDLQLALAFNDAWKRSVGR